MGEARMVASGDVDKQHVRRWRGKHSFPLSVLTQRLCIAFPYELSYGGFHGAKIRCLARHARAYGADDAGDAWAAAWLWHRPADRTNQRRPVTGQLRNSLSGAAQTGAGGLHQLGMGSIREQPQGEVL